MLLASEAGPQSDHWTTPGPEADHESGPERTRADILILEDDALCGSMLSEILRHEGANPFVFETVAAAREAVRQRQFDFYILDHKLPDGTGTAFYYSLLEQVEFAPAIMLTGVPDISKAVELTKTGLLDYLTKPFSLQQFRACLAQGLARRGASRSRQRNSLESESHAMRQVYRQARVAAANASSTVLLTGETGVGKDVLARLIHQLSQKLPGPTLPFISLNCATLPGDMFEAELFGAERGAYTGAHQKRAGLVEAAGRGTLFLDEIGEVPLHLQAKLLHLLEGREYRRLGEAAVQHFSGRIIAATNKPLADAVRAGTFRADLLYRLDVLSLQIPPLRERREDIPALSRTILTELVEKSTRPAPQLRAEDLDFFSKYGFPGNIRELRNILERSLLETPVDCAWLRLSSEAKKKLSGYTPPPAPVQPPRVLAPPEEATSQLTPLEAQEFQLLRAALTAENGAIRRAASRLRMSHQALLRRLQKWPALRAIPAKREPASVNLLAG